MGKNRCDTAGPDDGRISRNKQKKRTCGRGTEREHIRGDSSPVHAGMKKRILVLGAVVALVLAALSRPRNGASGSRCGAVAQSPRQQRPRSVPVDVATAAQEEGAGADRSARHRDADRQRRGQDRASTPKSSPFISGRRDGQAGRSAVHARQPHASKRRSSRSRACLRRDKAQLEQAQSATCALHRTRRRRTRRTLVTLEQRQDAGQHLHAPRSSPNTAQLELLRVQLDYTNIRAPIAGRASMAAVKVGNFVRQADLAPLATIIQTAPVYVTLRAAAAQPA